MGRFLAGMRGSWVSSLFILLYFISILNFISSSKKKAL